MQSREAASCAKIQVTAMSDEPLDAVQTPASKTEVSGCRKRCGAQARVPACEVQGAQAVPRSAADIGTSIAQQLQNVRESAVACDVYRRNAVHICRVTQGAAAIASRRRYGCGICGGAQHRRSNSAMMLWRPRYAAKCSGVRPCSFRMNGRMEGSQ
jgi:hypothetical protein